ncbi:hypothetical protein [Henriciella litoralis]|uniref:hypothetical protein n=1 Tax=Henriciella litoralis TaxID=568102 RepID=UPI0009FF0016|nr:hypothetical protein [Henriciella litoralis]
MSLDSPVQSRASLLDKPADKISWRWWALWLVGFGVFSMMAPRDASFDVAHYHLHNGWSVLNGRMGQDLAPAELHSFLNPVWQVFVWLLVDTLPGRLVGFLLGALQGLILPALYALTRRLMHRADATPSQMAVLAISLAGFTAEGMFGLLSSVRNDAVCAAAFLGALVMIIPSDRAQPSLLRFGLASLLMGALVGMKLTNSVYVLFFALAVPLLVTGWRMRINVLAVCAVSGLVGILVTGGWWAWYMYQTFENPIFPFMNTFFEGPLGPDTPFRDDRYVPSGLLGAVFRPFVFLFDGEMINEDGFFDPRLQLGYLASFALLAAAIWKTSKMPAIAARTAVAFGAAFIFTIIAWGLMFSIARYLLAIWILGPTFVAYALAVWKPEIWSAKYAPHASLGALALLFVVTQPSELRRVAWSTWTGPYIEAELPERDFANATIAFSGGYPSAFLSSFFPESARLTHLVPQVWSAPALANYNYQIRDLIRDPSRDLYVVIVDTESHWDEARERLRRDENVVFDEAACERIYTSLDSPGVEWKICPAEVTPG